MCHSLLRDINNMYHIKALRTTPPSASLSYADAADIGVHAAETTLKSISPQPRQNDPRSPQEKDGFISDICHLYLGRPAIVQRNSAPLGVRALKAVVAIKNRSLVSREKQMQEREEKGAVAEARVQAKVLAAIDQTTLVEAEDQDVIICIQRDVRNFYEGIE
ncbi:hypothetical protein N9L68_00835 [bacterium]|nr:hypothetical protein [bacterium]